MPFKYSEATTKHKKTRLHIPVLILVNKGAETKGLPLLKIHLKQISISMLLVGLISYSN